MWDTQSFIHVLRQVTRHEPDQVWSIDINNLYKKRRAKIRRKAIEKAKLKIKANRNVKRIEKRNKINIDWSALQEESKI
jgi:hypothetical protein